MKFLRGIFPLFSLQLIVASHLFSVTITIQQGNWGDVKLAEIKCVLDSTAGIFVPYSNTLRNKEIYVYETASVPKFFYSDPLRDEKIRINISAKNRHWCQYAFQFAHELGHLMCVARRGDSTNQWFEESLCEAASLFALERLSKTWSNSPPYPSWKTYAIEFHKYRTQRIIQSNYPENLQLPSWWESHKSVLSKSANLRKHNLWVAVSLLSLIEKMPDSAWSACAKLNESKNEHPKNFRQYLDDWKSACFQIKQKEFVEEIISLFGV